MRWRSNKFFKYCAFISIPRPNLFQCIICLAFEHYLENALMPQGFPKYGVIQPFISFLSRLTFYVLFCFVCLGLSCLTCYLQRPLSHNSVCVSGINNTHCCAIGPLKSYLPQPLFLLVLFSPCTLSPPCHIIRQMKSMEKMINSVKYSMSSGIRTEKKMCVFANDEIRISSLCGARARLQRAYQEVNNKEA